MNWGRAADVCLGASAALMGAYMHFGDWQHLNASAIFGVVWIGARLYQIFDDRASAKARKG